MKPSRLYRALTANAPLFDVVAGPSHWTDHQIRSVSIKRGGSDAIEGFTPALLDLALDQHASVRAEEIITVTMTDYGADLVAGLTGANPDLIRSRYHGRVGRQLTHDLGKRQTTTLYGSSWEAQLSHIPAPVQVSPNDQIAHLVTLLMSHPSLAGSGPHTRMAPQEQYGRVETPGDESTWKDLIPRFITDIGIYVRPLRAGGTQSFTKTALHARALERIPQQPPLTRSQALAPAEWDQPAETIPSNHRVIWSTGSGMDEQTFGTNLGDPAVPVTTHDMTHAKWAADVDAQPRLTGQTYRANEISSFYRIPSLTIDLLALIRSGTEYNLRQVRNLLSLQVGDPLFFSSDWYPQLRGVQYAIGLDEDITPGAWTLTLSLAPTWHVDGHIEQPDIPAWVWESAGYAWNTEARTWTAA